MKTDAAHSFWQAFDADAKVVADMVADGNVREAFERVEALLQKHGFDFCFELTREGSDTVLVLTPEGDQRVAQRIDNLVQAKRKIRGWRVYSRRQRKPLQDAVTFVRHIYGLDMSDATIDLQESADGYRVVMYSKAMESLTADEVRGLVETFLDHAVGEELVMSRVAKVSGQPTGHGTLSLPEMISRLTLG